MRKHSLILSSVIFLLAGCGTIKINVEYESIPTLSDAGFTQTLQPPPIDGGNTPAVTVPPAESPSRTPSARPPATAVALGKSHSCAVTGAGGVVCWGNNEHRQLGNGSVVNSSVPVEVHGLEDVQAVAAGWAHTCALTRAGAVKCWGYNKNGELGNGGTNESGTPVGVNGLTSGVKAIEAADDHTCAVTADGGVKCWGYNEFGQLGDGTKTSRSTPVDVQGLSGAVSAVAAGWGHTCALTADGSVKCWGNNEYGQLGFGQAVEYRLTPVAAEGLVRSAVKISADGGQTCALTIYGGIRCWGNNKYGQLGDGTAQTRNSPVPVTGLTGNVRDVAAGWNHACALAGDGGMKCWGWNYYGQLGDGTKASRTSPAGVFGISDGVAEIGVGWAHTCVVTSSGGVKCWGSNEYGQLGDGTNLDSQVPITVAGMNAAPGSFPTIGLSAAVTPTPTP